MPTTYTGRRCDGQLPVHMVSAASVTHARIILMGYVKYRVQGIERVSISCNVNADLKLFSPDVALAGERHNTQRYHSY